MNPARPAIARPQQDTPEDLVDRLLETIRGQFCAQMTGKEWGQARHFLKRNVVLWPARFMFGKGFTVPAARYEAILRSVFADIKTHGKADAIKYWPGYLMKCVQDHLRHHWEEYYAEAKSIRSAAETALMHLGKLQHQHDPTVEALAAAHKVLSDARRQVKRSAFQPAQRQLGFNL